MDANQAKQIIKKSHDCIDQIKQLRCKTLAQRAEATARVEILKTQLCEDMTREKLGELNYSQVNLTRQKLKEANEFLAEIPPLLTGLDLREREEREKLKEPISFLRNKDEENRKIQEYLRLQEQIIEQAASTGERLTDSFKNLVRKYRDLSMRIGKDGQSTEFLDRQGLL